MNVRGRGSSGTWARIVRVLRDERPRHEPEAAQEGTFTAKIMGITVAVREVNWHVGAACCGSM